jgi:hypothetical protein
MRRSVQSLLLAATSLFVFGLLLLAQGTSSPSGVAAAAAAPCGYAAYAGPEVSDEVLLERFTGCPCPSMYNLPDCAYVAYVDVIDASTGQIMEIYGAQDFFTARGGEVRSGLVTSGAGSRGAAVADAYAEQEHSRLWIRQVGDGKTIYLCSDYYNRFLLKVWCLDPVTCALKSIYVESSGPCPTASDVDNCRRTYFGNVIIWLELDSRVLRGIGADDVFHELYRSLMTSYRLSSRFTNESLVGVPLSAAGSTALGSRWFAELRIVTDGCASNVLARIQAVLSKYGLRGTVAGRQIRIST